MQGAGSVKFANTSIETINTYPFLDPHNEFMAKNFFNTRL